MRAGLVVTICLGFLFTSGAGFLFVSTASAQDNNKPDYDAAKRHYSSGLKAEQNKEWAIAAREYGIAYEIAWRTATLARLGSTSEFRPM